LQSACNAGEYYTPRAVTKFVTEMTNPKFGDKVFDPACGTGGFLVNAIEYIRANSVKTPEDEKVLEGSIFGVEKKPLPHLLCVTNMILHGIEVPQNIRRDNTLTRPTRDYTDKDRVDVILTNPPFGGTEEAGVKGNFPHSYQTTETADLFVYLIVHLLKAGGRAGIVLPDSFLSGDGVKARLKELIMEKCNLHTIVRLPQGVFNPYAGVRTSLFFFTKGEPTKDIWFYEMPLPTGIKQYTKGRPITNEDFEPVKDWWNNRIENEFAWKVNAEVVKTKNYDLHLSNPSKRADEIHDKDELLAEMNQLSSDISELVEKLQKAFKV
jgi:type I restriction enzyme M protein